MKRRPFSAAVVYMPCLRTGISDSRSVPAFCKRDRWIPRLNLLGIECASGGPAAHVKWERRRIVDLREGRMNGRKEGGDLFRHIAREACVVHGISSVGGSPVCHVSPTRKRLTI